MLRVVQGTTSCPHLQVPLWRLLNWVVAADPAPIGAALLIPGAPPVILALYITGGDCTFRRRGARSRFLFTGVATFRESLEIVLVPLAATINELLTILGF